MRFISQFSGGGETKEINPELLEEVDLDDILDTKKWSQEGRPRVGIREVLVYSKLARIIYVIIICLMVGVMSPYLMAVWGNIEFSPGNHDVNGTCKVKPGFRLNTFPELDPENVTEEMCHGERSAGDSGGREGCWNSQWHSDGDQYGDTPLCYHRLPSKHSLIVETWDKGGFNGTLFGMPMLGNCTSVEKVMARISSDKKGHVLVEVGKSVSDGLSAPANEAEPLVIDAGVPQGCPSCGNGRGVFSVDVKTRNDIDLSIARTHLGPIMMSDTLSEITMYLSSPWIFGPHMDTFMWNGKFHNSTFNLGRDSSQVHLPMIMGQHPDKHWFIIYLETSYPGEIVITPGSGDQPLVTWRTMGGSIKLHIFVGLPVRTGAMKTSLEQLMKLFQSHLYPNLTVPPYWSHGYHICRRGVSPRMFMQDVIKMEEGRIPYDTDCVDELFMPSAFDINNDYNVIALSDRGIGLLIPQLIQTATDSPSPPPSCVQVPSTDGKCIQGFLNEVNVTFPDPFSTTFTNWINSSYEELRAKIPHHGIYLHDTYPSNLPVYMLLNESCIEPLYIPNRMSIDDGTLCPYSWLPQANSSLLEQHASYSSKVIESFSSVAFTFSDTFMLGSRGAFLGSQFPATWQGLARSLREVLILGLSGLSMVSSPICGTQTSGDTLEPELLCLRWFQLASFFPSLRSYYTDTSNLPYTYSTLTYQQYVRWSLDTHYKLLPYLHTLEYEWRDTGFPAVRPMFLDYSDRPFLNLSTQFMLGQDILVAPILQPQVDLLPVELPSGTWYTLFSGNCIPSNGSSYLIHTHLYEIPAFQRGGSILVTHETAAYGLKDTLDNTNYTITAGLNCRPDPRSLTRCTAQGHAYIGGDSVASLQVNVTSSGTNTGRVDIHTKGDMTGVNPLGSLQLFGLAQGGPMLTVTLSWGGKVIIIEAKPDFSTNAWYDVDKQTLIVRNIGLEWSNCHEGCQELIKWQFWSS